jgi:uncharacterized membrane protein YhhN
MLSSGRARLAYVALAAVDTALAGSRRPMAHRARYLTKPLLMPMLAASLASHPRRTSLRTPVLTAQACAWVGDVGLLSERRTPFLVGTTGFGLGHAAYVWGFHPLRDRSSRVYDERPARALAATWLAVGPLLGLAARRERLGPAIMAYSAALTTMVVSATRLSADVPAPARRLAAAGALTFLASDSTLGLRRFVLADPPPAMESAVMATYTAAQLMLSEAAARA